MVSALGVLFLFVLTCALHNGKAALQVFSFTLLPFSTRVTSFFTTFFDLRPFGTGVIVVSVFTSFLGGIAIGALYAYYRIRSNALSQTTTKSSLSTSVTLSSFAYALTLIGMQCTACGTALLTTFLTLVGGVWLNQHLPLHGLEIGILGLCIQGILVYILMRKLAYPLTC